MMYCTDIPVNFNKDASKTPDDADHHLLGINYVNHVHIHAAMPQMCIISYMM